MPIRSDELFRHLQLLIELPREAVEMTIHLAVNEVATVDCKFHHGAEVEITNLSSRACEYALGYSGSPVTKRYRLVELQETGQAQPASSEGPLT